MSEPIDKEVVTDKSDLVTASTNIFMRLNWKVALFILIIGCLIFSDVFIDNVLKNINSDFVDTGCVTSGGTAIQVFVLAISTMFFDLFIQYKLL